MFKKILIANRGEIARRVILTLHKMNIIAVAVYDNREKNSQYVQDADEAYPLGTGPLSESFLNIEKIIGIAKTAEVQAIHPGYGFLSENPKFARRCEEEGIVFIGPGDKTLESLGNKVKALNFARLINVPVIPGIQGSPEYILKNINKSFFPCIIKAAAGGGGKGMEIVTNFRNLRKTLLLKSKESEKYFADSEVFVEKYLKDPRHIEVQILGDKKGNVIHLFERECSIQRRYQKIIEEAPAPNLSVGVKNILYQDALRIAKEVKYHGVGTVEFLLDGDENHYFLEMNTRIQVEHGVTELITGIDIVAEQIKIANGKELSMAVTEAKIDGHSIEARICSENPELNYRPSSGKVNLVHFPEKNFLRVDTSLKSGDTILNEFDSLQAKIIVHGRNRDEAVKNLGITLSNSIMHGVRTNIGLLNSIANNDDFKKGNYNTSFLTGYRAKLKSNSGLNASQRKLLIATGTFLSIYHLKDILLIDKTSGLTKSIGYWRLDKKIKIALNKKEYDIRFSELKNSAFTIYMGKSIIHLSEIRIDINTVYCKFEGKRCEVFFSWNTENLLLQLGVDHRIYSLVRTDFLESRKWMNDIIENENPKTVDTISAPLNGKIIRINRKSGQLLKKGDIVLTIESMKMENDICIPFHGHVNDIFINVGDQVQEGQKLFGVIADLNGSLK